MRAQDCAECNGTGVAEMIGGYERPCGACHGKGISKHRTPEDIAVLVERLQKASTFCGPLSDVSHLFEEAATALSSHAADMDELRHKLRMIVCHASGGNLDLDEHPSLLVNDISVRISQHHNRIWDAAQEKTAADIASRDAAMLTMIRDEMSKHVENWPNPKKVKTAVALIGKTLAASRDEVVALREAFTPSGSTKAAYMGEFSFKLTRVDECGDEYPEKVYVPWTTIKEIMAAIRARATLTKAER